MKLVLIITLPVPGGGATDREKLARRGRKDPNLPERLSRLAGTVLAVCIVVLAKIPQ